MASPFRLWHKFRAKRRKVDKVLIIDTKNSIIAISHQSKKWRILMGLCLGSGAMAILSIIALFADSKFSTLLLSLADEYVWGALCFSAIIAVFLSMICLSLMIKCPRCNLRWFWHGIAKDPKRNIAIGHMSYCPRCNYPDKERDNGNSALISIDPILEVSNQKNKFRYLWQAFFAASAIMFLGIVGLINYYQLFNLWRICLFGGFFAAFSMLVSLWISIRCPQCGLRWYWYAFSKDSKYFKIRQITHCPRCDYPDQKNSSGPSNNWDF